MTYPDARYIAPIHKTRHEVEMHVLDLYDYFDDIQHLLDKMKLDFIHNVEAITVAQLFIDINRCLEKVVNNVKRFNEYNVITQDELVPENTSEKARQYEATTNYINKVLKEEDGTKKES